MSGSGDVGSSNISFSGLEVSWGNVGYPGGSDPGSTDGNDPISLSEFRGATFTDGTSVPSGSDLISINNHFKGKIFGGGGGGSGGINHTTDSFKVYDNWSAYPYTPKKLTHSNGNSSYVGTDIANKRAILLTGQTSSSAYQYPIILFTPGNPTSSSDSPGLIVDRNDPNCIDEVTLWLKVVAHSSYNNIQFGIIKKDDGLTWSQQLSYLDDYHSTYKDRLAFHGAGYHNYAGSRDDIVSTDIDNIDNNQYGSNLTTNFHNRNMTTGGTKKSNPDPGTVNYTEYFMTNSYYNYPDYRSNSIYSHIGFKLKWYETTIQADLTEGEKWIVPGNGAVSFSDLTNVFAGMYISGTGIPTNTFIAEIHTNYIKLYDELSNTPDVPGKSITDDGTNITLTVNGYLYWTLASPSSYDETHIMGPPHTVLPRIQEVSTETKEWALFIGDTTSSTSNTFSYDIRNTNPSGSPFVYSVSYSSGDVPTSGGGGVYEFAINVDGGTYAISGSLSSISTPLSSGYSFSNQTRANQNYYSYVMGSRIQFLTAGTVVAIGAQNRYGATMALYPDTDNTAVATVTIEGTNSSSTTRNYRYTTLTTPVSVAANSIYRVALKNSTGGYAYHYINSYIGTPTASGNIKLLGGAYSYVGRYSSITRPTNNVTSINYGSTDLIFLPS